MAKTSGNFLKKVLSVFIINYKLITLKIYFYFLITNSLQSSNIFIIGIILNKVTFDFSDVSSISLSNCGCFIIKFGYKL